MKKVKIAICMSDLEYQARFVNCFMNHYNHQYELHVFTSLEQLHNVNVTEHTVIITGEFNTDEMTKVVETGQILLVLTEDLPPNTVQAQEGILYAEKYQEVYKIAEILERLVADQLPTQTGLWGKKECAYWGVYSLTQEQFQAPFVALLGKIIGAQEKVLVLDLQQYSGLGAQEEGMNSMGLEDLLSVVTTGNYSRGRILECIQHESEWDYVQVVHNSECLAEGTGPLYESLLEMMTRELGYEKIIINFGTAFLGQLEIMESCQKIFLLNGTSGSKNWREDAFFQEIQRMDKESLELKITKIEIPGVACRGESWKILAENWSWSTMGERLRQDISKEISYAAVV